MSDAEPAGRTNQLGVVDPIRIPGLDTGQRFWNGLPVLGRLFVVVAAIDLLVRLSGLLGLPTFFEFGVLSAILSAFPHYAVLLFPTLVLARRADAATSTPLIFRGAVAASLTELLSGTITLLLAPSTEGGLAGWMVVQLAVAIASAGAFLALGFGLKALDRSTPSPTTAGLGNLVGGLIAGAAVLGIIVQLTRPPIDLGLPDWNLQVLVASIAALLSMLAFAFLARTIIRGATDASRPRPATRLAAGAMVLNGVDALLTLAIGVLVLIATAFPAAVPLPNGGFGIGFLGAGFAMGLLAVAFGLGLGDPSVRIPRTSLPEESPA